MCSSENVQLARACLAIEELARCSARSGTARAGRQPAHDAAAADDDIAVRLAAVWAMVADADPELARRLPGYLGEALV